MKQFEISKQDTKISSIKCTIRLKPQVYKKLMQISKERGISYNELITKGIKYALDHVQDN